MLRIVYTVSRPSTGLLGKASAQSRRTIASSSARHADITLTVNGKEVTVPQGSALIQACEAAGATIPRFCYHDRLAIAGNCRMCLVEVERSPKPVASCAMPAMPGSKVFTDTPLVKEAREGVMEFLLANHPLDCPICDQGGECDLQDQSMRYGSDRTRFHEITGKRAVENKDLGPIVKTSMNRCIQCTRCVRFANEVAGVEELGTTGRGNDMQIGMYVSKVMDSELSGNIIDLCPVGALTSKPYAFTARPWELKNTESVDVLDAVGSNIRIDSRGVQVMRIQPRTNDDVNEEWINDKTRYAYDGLRTQRLTTPLIKSPSGDRFVAATWEDALSAIKAGLEASGAKGNEIQGIAGALADTESLVVLRDLIHRLGSENLTTDIPSPGMPSADIRSNYLFNATIPGVESADAILLVGTHPRHEAAVLNSRIRKSWLAKEGLEIGLIGERVDTTYGYEYLGGDVQTVLDFVEGKKKGAFADKFREAKRPLVILGSAVGEMQEGRKVYEALAEYVKKNKDRFITPEWNGFSVLQRHASRTAAYDLAYLPSPPSSSSSTPKFIYLLNADNLPTTSIPSSAFVVYQGHHGDAGAALADVVLPGAAYTEKAGTWVNTEGRAQVGRAAVPPPGAAREDWKIIRALSEVLGTPLPYDDILDVRDRLWEIAPSLVRYDVTEQVSPDVALMGLESLSSKKGKEVGRKIGEAVFRKPIDNFYQTDVISRASKTMAECTRAFVLGKDHGFSDGAQAQAAYA
ncbi:NADH-ubiquinone oxidoreductase 78 kDa subunit, mitochondrial [Termitomyces sp. J132]|nr:hypothetical protein H2248_003615 [Termitomyces sp. 'cryptogamus']KNZ81084.1 NADH-ubiquinone oxidoreductase 78 kDa subunit, mitochondrial [Termitomyces sp. J132]